MAFTVLPAPSGKHRRPRRRITHTGTKLAGVAVATAAGVGTIAGPAVAVSHSFAPGAVAADRTAAEDTGLGQAVSVGNTLADSIAAQAVAQRQAADLARLKAEAAQRKAAAEKAAQRAGEEREALAVAERAARKAEARRKLSAFTAPVGGGVSTSYKSSGGAWSSGYHTGIDFSAPGGTTVRATGGGTVVEAGWSGSYGNSVVIRHADGMFTQYGHLSSMSVPVGATVTTGQQIGLSGSTGNSSGPHLHFEARTSADYGSDVDPLAYLRSKGVGI